jgi:disulfide bond formation protein DsbB
MPTSVNRSDIPVLLLLLAAIIALGAAYGSQHFGDLQPCKLCLYQRWPWWAVLGLASLTFVLPVSAEVKKRALIILGLVLFVGTSIAIYHTGVEQKWWPGPATCSGVVELPKTLSELHSSLQRAVNVPCDEVPWSFMGISMAGYNAIASGTAALFAFSTGLRKT